MAVSGELTFPCQRCCYLFRGTDDDTGAGGGRPPGSHRHRADTCSALPPSTTPALFSLGNRTTLVTGGARGLGLTVAHALLECGSDVVAFDLLPPVEDEWASAQAAATEAGTTLTYVALDVTDGDAVDLAVADAFKNARQSHPVRGLFHAAGIQLLCAATELTPGQWRKIIDVNLTGSYLLAAAFARSFFAAYPQAADGTLPTSQAASIVFVASMSGRVANLGIDCAPYNASKAGVSQLARNLAMEWGKKGIRVNVSYLITRADVACCWLTTRSRSHLVM